MWLLKAAGSWNPDVRQQAAKRGLHMLVCGGFLKKWRCNRSTGGNLKHSVHHRDKSKSYLGHSQHQLWNMNSVLHLSNGAWKFERLCKTVLSDFLEALTDLIWSKKKQTQNMLPGTLWHMQINLPLCWSSVVICAMRLSGPLCPSERLAVINKASLTLIWLEHCVVEWSPQWGSSIHLLSNPLMWFSVKDDKICCLSGRQSVRMCD